MSLGLIGKKLGMTRIFTEDGFAVPVTVVDVSGNQIVQRKTSERNGYSAVQVGYDDQKVERLNRPEKGHFAANSADAKKRVREFRFESDEALPAEDEKDLSASLFQKDQFVDVIGTTKGKGFQGVMKRWGFHGSPATHGSMMHRRPGAVGCGTDPGRIWPGRKMPGRHGNYRRTVQNLRIVAVREEDNVLLISGALPGAKGGYIVVRPAKKRALPSQG